MREKLAQSGPTPFEVMVSVMRYTFDMAQEELKQNKPDKSKLKWAFELALEAANRTAPYAHQRMTAVDPRPTLHYQRLTADELRIFIPLFKKCITDPPASATEEGGAAPPDPQK
jgi:hypothetical protein